MKKILTLLLAALLLCGCTRIITTNNDPETTQGALNQETTTVERTTEEHTSASAAQTSEATEPSEIETETEAETETETETGIPDEELNLMQKVLLDKAEFMDVETGSFITLSQVSRFSVSKNTMFYYQDLDGDGSFEVCVDSPIGRWSIFSVIDGIVYRYDYPFRGMIPLYKDGTMHGSSGASSPSLSRFTGFTKEGYTEEHIALANEVYGTMRYYTDFKDGHYINEISKEEYDEILSKYPQIESEKYEFTRNNIERYVK
ncbi:MAG: hypothetical protein ACI4EN_09400 [Butyrivibrio sp.]